LSFACVAADQSSDSSFPAAGDTADQQSPPSAASRQTSSPRQSKCMLRYYCCY
jgi:hypothetical protein